MVGSNIGTPMKLYVVAIILKERRKRSAKQARATQY